MIDRVSWVRRSVLRVVCAVLVVACAPAGDKSTSGTRPETPDGSAAETGGPVTTPPDPHSGGVGAHTALDPTGAASHTGAPPATGWLVPPAAVAGESVVCYVLEPQNNLLRLYAVGMDTGTLVEHSRWGAATSSFHTAGIAYHGAHLLTGGYSGNAFSWYDLDLAANTKTAGPPHGAGAENGVAYYDDGANRGFLTLEASANRLDRFATAADVVAGVPPNATLPGFSGFTRFTTDGPTLYGAWHSPREVLVYDVPSGSQTGTILLEDWNAWVWGMSVVGGRLYLIDDGRGLPGQLDPRIGVFDLAGNSLGNVLLTHHPFARGLVCLAP